MSSVSQPAPIRTLADLIPRPRHLPLVRDLVLMLGGAASVGLAAQVMIPLPFTPVPLSLQTFAVLLVGAALGSARGAGALIIYLAAGVAGLPWFAGGGTGWAFASFGYVIGFVFAAALVGKLAERGGDRAPLRTALIMVLGNLVILSFGVAGLLLATGVDFNSALRLGVLPFLLGDLIKIAAAAGLLPLAWALVRRSPRQ